MPPLSSIFFRLAIALLALATGCPGLFAASADTDASSAPPPACLRLPLPKVLYVADSPNREQWAELVRHAAPADVAFAPLVYGDQECHHLCDKPLEETKEETQSVVEKGRQHVDRLLGQLDRFDLVVAQFSPAKETAIQRRLAAWVRGGGCPAAGRSSISMPQAAASRSGRAERITPSTPPIGRTTAPSGTLSTGG